MIHQIICVTLECDNCKKDYENYNGFSVFLEESNVYEEAVNDNWYHDGDKCYCPDCYTLADEDNLILKTTKKTSDKWINEYDCQILDPDGWDRTNYDYSFYKEEITRQEFERRLFVSTVVKKTKKTTNDENNNG